jgi:mannose-6-phosphate isomerase-like protein (cupin superfamily)
MKRAESWTIIKGQGIVTIDGIDQKVSAGESIKINKQAKHRIFNNGDTPSSIYRGSNRNLFW